VHVLLHKCLHASESAKKETKANLCDCGQIGGSLAKLVYFSSEPGDEEGGRLNFLKFETDKIDTCIEFMKRLKKEYMQRNGSGTQNDLCVMATGGGAYKYYDRIKEALGVEVMREDEMECLIIGEYT
jgi:type II pantothenate kinase